MTARWMVGRLESSTFFTDPPGARSRVMPALVTSFRPRWLEGIELGGTRVFHVRWQAGALTWSIATLPFSGLLKASNPTGETTTREYNQLGSVFVRIAPPGGGTELYGELYREDHNWDTRDLIGQPDHASAHMVGIRRAWRAGQSDIRAVTLEVVNGRLTHLARVRGEAPIYIHGAAGLGHTFRGQPLGSSAAIGGGGFLLAHDRIGLTQSLTVVAEVQSVAQDQEGGSFQGRRAARAAFQVIRNRTTGGWMPGWSVRVEQGTGFDRRFNLTLGGTLAMGVGTSLR